MDLLQPVTPDVPCGESLEDSPLLLSFDEFRLFGRALPFDVSGRALTEEEKKANPIPDWGDMRKRSLEALAKSKDLRILAHLAGALIRTDGLSEFADTVVVAADWLDQHWAAVFPLVDEDAILRRSALNCFADPVAVIDGVRRAALVSSRQHGTFSLRDIDIATRQLVPGEGDRQVAENQVKAAFGSMPIAALIQLQDDVADAVTSLNQIDAAMREAAGSEATPGFDALTTQLSRMSQVLRAQLASHPDQVGAATAGSQRPDTPDAGPSAIGVVQSRQDAIRALDAVAAFFRQSEPSSPIPLFLERAKRLVSKDFLEVLADIAPDAVQQARAAGGLKEGE